MNTITECRNLRRLTLFVQQPFLSGGDLNNEHDVCPNIGKGHPHMCLTRACQNTGTIEVGSELNFVDRIYEATCTLTQQLLSTKQGAIFERIALEVAGYGGKYPKPISIEGQRQQIAGTAHKRSFIYENPYTNGRRAVSFDVHLMKETTQVCRGKFLSILCLSRVT